MIKQNGIIFCDESHEYFTENGGVKLSGITGIIKKYVTPNKYADVPAEVLNYAAERGSYLHEVFEKVAIGFIPEITPQGEEYGLTDMAILDFQKAIAGFEFIDNEVLVSDYEHYATAVDLVANNNDLIDLKFTAKRDDESLRWQLSINAYLYEHTFKDRKAGRLFGIHFDRAKCKTSVVEFERIPDEIVKSLLDAAANDVEWINPLKPAAELDTAERLSDICALIDQYKAHIAELEAERAALVAPLLDQYKVNGQKTGVVGNVKISIKAASIRETIDAKSFKADNPELAAKYIKVSRVAESVSYSIV